MISLAIAFVLGVAVGLLLCMPKMLRARLIIEAHGGDGAAQKTGKAP